MSDRLMSTISECTAALSRSNLDQEAANLMKDISTPKTVQEHSNVFRDMIKTTGTNVDQNDADPFGDGDQTPIRAESKCQVFRNIWCEGGDIMMLLQARSFSPFAMDCIQGKKQQVHATLQNASTGVRAALLERRESCYRIPPILLVMGLAKHKPLVQQLTGTRLDQMDHEGVAKVLLQYGARPDAKDVSGKTAVHWGAGCASNDTTRNVADYCIAAARTCRAYGKTVTLHSLSKEEYNGLSGTLGGYMVDKDRRIVHVVVDCEAKELLIQPKNILFEGEPLEDSRYNLVDVQDRLGSVALHEVVMRENEEAARFLCKKHNASVDIPDNGGSIVRNMVHSLIGGLVGPTISIIKKHAARHPVVKPTCNTCKKQEQEKRFSRCGRCEEVIYCSRECQVADWNEHKLLCNKGKNIKLSKECVNPFGESGMTFNSAKGAIEGKRYRAPDNVKVGEKFWIKVQNTPTQGAPLCVYDKTRVCQFIYGPGPGYNELDAKVRAEKGACGRKTHFQASFDSNGDMTVYTKTAELKSW